MIENANIENMDMNNCFGGEHIEAIEHILSDYKRVLKENEYMHNELNKQETTINKYAKENEELKHKVEGQKCVIEIQGHNEEVYEKLVIKLEKENTELKEENEADYTTVYLKRGL